MWKMKFKITLILALSVALTGCSYGELPDEENLHPDGIIETDEDGLTYGYAPDCDVYQPDITATDEEYEEGCADWASGKLWFPNRKWLEGVPTEEDLNALGFTAAGDNTNRKDCMVTFNDEDGHVLNVTFNSYGHISSLISGSPDLTFVKGLKSNPSRSDIKKKLGTPVLYTRGSIGFMDYEYETLNLKYIIRFSTSDDGELVETCFTYHEIDIEGMSTEHKELPEELLDKDAINNKTE